jgi:hypothetical protein
MLLKLDYTCLLQVGFLLRRNDKVQRSASTMVIGT